MEKLQISRQPAIITLIEFVSVIYKKIRVTILEAFV